MLFVFLFFILPVLELYLLIKIGGVLGAWSTIGMVLAIGAFGAWLVHQQGLRVLAAVRADLGKGRLPAESLLHGALLILGGILLITPGIITDIVGLALLVPFTRRFFLVFVRRFMERAIARGQVRVYTQQGAWSGPPGRPGHRPPPNEEKAGEVIDISHHRDRRNTPDHKE